MNNFEKVAGVILDVIPGVGMNQEIGVTIRVANVRKHAVNEFGEIDTKSMIIAKEDSFFLQLNRFARILGYEWDNKMKYHLRKTLVVYQRSFIKAGEQYVRYAGSDEIMNNDWQDDRFIHNCEAFELTFEQIEAIDKYAKQYVLAIGDQASFKDVEIATKDEEESDPFDDSETETPTATAKATARATKRAMATA